MNSRTVRTDPATDRSVPWTRGMLRLVSVVVPAATAVNLGLYLVGHLTGATLRLDPGVGPANHQLTAPDVAWKTAVPLLLGVAVLMLARRRSRRSVTVVTVLGVAVAIGTGAVPPLGAHDPVTGVLLVGMHTVPGVAVLIIGTALRRTPDTQPRPGAGASAASRRSR